MRQHGTLRHLSRVALVGGRPYERNLVHGWLSKLPSIRSIVPIVDGTVGIYGQVAGVNGSSVARNGEAVGGVRPGGVRTGGVRSGSSTPRGDIDLVVGILADHRDPALTTCQAVLAAERGRTFIAVLGDPEARVVQRVVDMGADAVVAVRSGSRAMAAAVAAASAGAAWLDPALSPIVMEHMGRGPTDNAWGLTPTEIRVAECFLEGLTNREIAERLEVSTETIKSHVRNIYEKMDVKDRSAAAANLRRWLRAAATASTPSGQ